MEHVGKHYAVRQYANKPWKRSYTLDLPGLNAPTQAMKIDTSGGQKKSQKKSQVRQYPGVGGTR